MKKLIMLLSFTTIFLLAACQRAVPSALECQENGEPLKVGMSLQYPPFETRENNVPVGISVDIAKAFGEHIGCEIEIVDMNFGNLIDALILGDIGVIIASMSATPAREELIMFSDPYMYFQIIGLMNKDFADAQGYTEDTTVDEILANEDVTYVGIAGQVSASLPLDLGIPQSRVLFSSDLDSAAQRVVLGDVDVLMMSSSPVLRNHVLYPDDTIVIWDSFLASPIAMGMRQGETELQALANEFIASMFEEGGVYEQIRADWDAALREILLDREGLDFFLRE